MSKNIRTQIGKVIGKTLNSYHARVKPVIDDIKFKEQYQGRIIDCMVGEVDDNYIETPETDAPIVKLEHSKEGIVKVPSIKGKTILIDSEGNETDTPAEGCRLVSVGEEEDNKLIILSKNSDSSLHHKTEILLDEPLRKLPNGVCDEIVGNKIIRRVGTMLIDGSKHWGAFQNYDLTYKYGMGIPHSIIKSTTVMTDNIFYAQRLTIEDESSKTQICIYNHQAQKEIRVSFLKSDYPMITNQAKSVEDYFKEHPLLLLYERTEPIIEELPNGIALQGFDDTTMYIENSIVPTVQYGYNALIPYKEELRTQKEEVENNTLDIEQNIIPYLMDMEFNLMLMEDN